MSANARFTREKLVIDSNLGRISRRFRDMASFPLKNIHFSYRLESIQAHFWNCFPCSRSPKFCKSRFTCS